MTPEEIQLVERKNALDRLNKAMDKVNTNPILAQEIDWENLPQMTEAFF